MMVNKSKMPQVFTVCEPMPIMEKVVIIMILSGGESKHSNGLFLYSSSFQCSFFRFDHFSELLKMKSTDCYIHSSRTYM